MASLSRPKIWRINEFIDELEEDAVEYAIERLRERRMKLSLLREQEVLTWHK